MDGHDPIDKQCKVECDLLGRRVPGCGYCYGTIDRIAKMSFARGVYIVVAVACTPACGTANCIRPGAETVRVAAVEARLELRLVDGRLIRLVGLDAASDTPGDVDLGERSRAALASRLVGKSIALAIRADRPDRWGRLPADADLPDAPTEGGLAAGAIARGEARYFAEPAAHVCRDALLAAENAARTGKLGLWNDPYYAVLAADDREGFTERSGTVVVAEGELTAIQSGPYRTTLRFAASGRQSLGGRMLVATIAPRTMKRFRKDGFDPASLIGKRLRFRGLLDLRFGPQVEIDSRDDLETVPSALQPPTRPH